MLSHTCWWECKFLQVVRCYICYPFVKILITQNVFYFVFQVGDSEFYECYESVTKILYNYCNYPSSHPACLPLPKPQPRINLMTRPSAYGDTDLPTIYENPVTTIYVWVDHHFITCLLAYISQVIEYVLHNLQSIFQRKMHSAWSRKNLK